jgi:hypothetical protein
MGLQSSEWLAALQIPCSVNLRLPAVYTSNGMQEKQF